MSEGRVTPGLPLPAEVRTRARIAWCPVPPPYGPGEQSAAGRRAAAAALTAAAATESAVGRGADGRPLFPPGFAGSISHTDRLAVALVAPGAGAVGVDIEDQGRAVTPALIDACTSPAERALCAEAPNEAERRVLFYRIWTRKEALLKASGIGMGVPLAGLDVAPTAPHATLLLPGDGDGPAATTSPFTAESLSGLAESLSGALSCAGERLPSWRLLTLHPHEGRRAKSGP